MTADLSKLRFEGLELCFGLLKLVFATLPLVAR